ncbi:hypothetical protein KDL45_12310 [bacterium]|nr:hypothetical protein [bacterium]
MGSIDFGNAFSVGFSGYGKNVINLAVATLIAGIIGGVTLGICMPAMIAGLYIMSLKAVRGEGTEIGDIFGGFKGFGRYFLGFLLAILLVVGGVIALCVGVFVVAGVLIFFYPLLVDRQDLSIGDALGECWTYFKGDWLMAILFAIVTNLISQAGSLVAIGFLFTVPISTCIVAAAYDQVFKTPAAVPAAAPPAAEPIG